MFVPTLTPSRIQDLFHDRCVDLIEFVRIVSDFIKLEKIYLGNTKGAVLTGVLRTIHEEFMTAMAAFRAAPYDVADVRRPEFDAHFFAFKTTIQVYTPQRSFRNPLPSLSTKTKTMSGSFSCVLTACCLLEREKALCFRHPSD